MKYSARSRCARLMIGVAAGAMMLGATPVLAQDIARIELAPQSLASALYEFGRQTGHQVIFSPELTRSKTSQGVSSGADEQVAMAQLLAGTGLTFRREGNTFMIMEAADPQSGSAAGDGAEVEALIVTAQKKQEDIQDVPIAISAFTQESLEAQKIEGGFDLLRAIPNVTFSKNNYSGYNFSIRGVGTKSISATSDAGVAVSFNNTSLIRNRLFEQEYMDVERVEVLRGPQGTLYGRNATAGVVNVITAKPVLDAFEGSIKAEVGNYDSRRMSAFVNVPLVSDRLAMRIAGSATQRDGYGFNSATGESIDGRDLWSGRVSVAFRPTERLRADFIWEHFSEDDDRLRTGKQLCHRDPGAVTFPGVEGPISPLLGGRVSQGCMQGSLYDAGAYQAPNGYSIPFIAAGQMITAFGLTAPRYFEDGSSNPDWSYVRFLDPDIDPYQVPQSRDLRTISSTMPTRYEAEADIFALDVSFDLTDSLTFTSQTLYNEDRVYSLQDYHRFSLQPTIGNSTGTFTTSGICGFFEQPPCSDPGELESFAPGGIFTDPQIGPSDAVAGLELSSSESEQFSQEIRLVSNFEGPLNFSVGANYLKFDGLNDYYLFFNIVTMLAQGYYNQSPVLGECGTFMGFGCMTVDTSPIENLNGDGHNYFRNRNPYELESIAGFGEVYWQATDALKLTAGLRYTHDHKEFTPWRSQLLIASFDYGPAQPIIQEWREFTGRIGFDWKPTLSFTDETMIYGSYSRGYKGGGANPPPAEQVAFAAVAIAPTFEPEFVDAFEIGAKNTFLQGALTLNGSAFFYDYTDYQVSKVYDRTIVNENFDAKVWGLELESVWRPTYQLRLNATLGYLQTSIADGERSIDIFNRTQGREGWTVVTPWIQQTSNCVLPDEFVATALNLGVFELAPVFSPIIRACVLWNNEFVLGIDNFDPADYPDANRGAGFYADLSDNELPNSPHWTFNIGAQYTWDFAEGWEATVRGDYYRQAESYSRVYNLESDRLRGWDNTNLSLRIERPRAALAMEVYVKNAFDETPITDAFLNSDSTGMTTNIFTLDPRLIGVSIRKGF